MIDNLNYFAILVAVVVTMVVVHVVNHIWSAREKMRHRVQHHVVVTLRDGTTRDYVCDGWEIDGDGDLFIHKQNMMSVYANGRFIEVRNEWS